MTPRKPEISLDMDGVLATPPFGVNIAIGRRLNLRPLDANFRRFDEDGRRSRNVLRTTIERLKYVGRPPLPDVREALHELREYRDPIIVTARSWLAAAQIESWLTRHELKHLIRHVFANNTSLSPGQHKLRVLRERGIAEHVDDDGSIAYYLAHNGMAKVYLRRWLLNRGLPYPTNVMRVRSLGDVVADIRTRAETSTVSPSLAVDAATSEP